MKFPFFVCVIFFHTMVAAQTFTDITPGNIPGIEQGDVAWADYNNDGYLDFAIMGIGSTGPVGGIYTGAGDGTFQLLSTSNIAGMRSGDLDWGDFDNDGDLDLAMIGETTVIMRNDITSFQQYFTVTGSQGGSLMWFDYDNDGDLDLYQVGSFFDNRYPNSVFINTDGQFSTSNVFSVKGYYSELAVDNTVCVATDFDNDGDQDIFSSGKYSYGVWNAASLLVNNGAMNIENLNDYRFVFNDVGIRSGSVNQGDFNKDGWMDYILTGNSSSISNQNVPFSKVMMGTGGANFLRKGNLLDVYSSSSDIGDIDNDDDLDAIISGQSSQGLQSKIFSNDGSGNFSDAGVANLVGLIYSSVALGDYDNDGDLDILISGRDAGNKKITKLYRNNLLSKTLAPNERPTPPANLRFRMENNTVILEWDKSIDKETPVNSLTYNVYVGIASKKPFRLFPQAIVETGKRTVYDQGNASVNTRWTLKGLKSGTYNFSVQAIDGANAGSAFAPEISFLYTQITPVGPTCEKSEQTFTTSPAGNYSWSISGGKIIQGQGSEKIVVKWDKRPVNPKIMVSTTGSTNSYVPIVQTLPGALISGPAVVCDTRSYSDYSATTFSKDVSYSWSLEKVASTSYAPSIQWPSPGNKLVTLAVTDLITGCKNYDTLHVAVAERIVVDVKRDGDGYYRPKNTSPDYSYTWEQYVSNTWKNVGAGDKFAPTSIGNYRLTIFNQQKCSYTGNFIVNEVITGLEEQSGKLQIVPNPATTSFKVFNLPESSKPIELSLIDMTGRIVLTTSTTTDAMDINCTSFPAGLYIVVINAAGKSVHSKIVIK